MVKLEDVFHSWRICLLSLSRQLRFHRCNRLPASIVAQFDAFTLTEDAAASAFLALRSCIRLVTED